MANNKNDDSLKTLSSLLDSGNSLDDGLVAFEALTGFNEGYTYDYHFITVPLVPPMTFYYCDISWGDGTHSYSWGQLTVSHPAFNVEFWGHISMVITATTLRR